MTREQSNALAAWFVATGLVMVGISSIFNSVKAHQLEQRIEVLEQRGRTFRDAQVIETAEALTERIKARRVRDN